MPTDLAIAKLTLSLYHEEEWSTFDHVERPESDSGICWAIKSLEDATVVITRGSTTKQDWFRDFLALPAHEMMPYSVLGPVHSGFSVGLPVAWGAIKQIFGTINKPVVFAGHSLGAARAWILAAMSIVDGIMPSRIVVFGSPRPGFSQLATVINEAPQKSYRNGHDVVCAVPFTIPPSFLYVEPAAFTLLDVAPAADDPWGPLAHHHMELYVAGLSI